jgi:MFS family permease
MNSAASSPVRLTRQRPFVLFWLARLASTMGYQMLALTIGWQVYELTNSAFDLGLVGLIQFVPAVFLTLLIGHAADRYDRRLIVPAAHGVYALAAIMITAALLTGTLSRDCYSPPSSLSAAHAHSRCQPRTRLRRRLCPLL